MTRFGAVVMGVILVGCSSLYAQFDQTYVSAEQGNDNHSCEFGHPCRTINRAVSQTNARGEVIILDSGPYQPFTVSKSINITAAPGVQPTITVGTINQGLGALINAGPQDDVTLRGLSITRAQTAGIRFNSGRALLVESCTINGSGTAGIWVNGAGSVFIKDTTVRNGAGGFDGHGIMVLPSSGTAIVTVEHCRLENNDPGVGFGGAGDGILQADSAVQFSNSKVTVRDTVSSGNVVAFSVFSATGSAEMNLENCLASGNGAGVVGNASGSGNVTIRVSGSVITDNLLGVGTGGGAVAILSRGNNTVEGNTQSNGSFTGAYFAK
jgi:hypothetical protein